MQNKNAKVKKIIAYGIYLLLFLLPFQTRYFLYSATLNGEFWEYGSYTLYVSEALLIVLVVLAFIDTLRDKGNALLFLKKKRTLLEVAVLLFLLYLFASTLWSVNPIVSFIYTIRFIELGMFVWLLRSANYDFRIAAFCFIGGMIVQGALGITQFFTQSLPANKWLGIAAQDPRASGVSVVQTFTRRFLRGYGGMPHPNILGGWLMFGLFTIIPLYHRIGNGFRLLLLVAYSVLFTALILTFSRSAWLGFFAGWFLFLTVAARTVRFRIWFSRASVATTLLALTALLSIVLGFLLKEPLTERGRFFSIDTRREALGAAVLEEKSLADRAFAIQESRAIIKKHPLFGGGIGTYTYERHRAFPKLSALELQPVHVVFLLIASELGLIGLLLTLAILFLWLKWLFRNYQVLGGMMTVGLLTITFFDHYVWTLQAGLLLIGLVVGLSQKKIHL